MDYIILEGSSVAELTEKVKDHIARGWEPQGGVSAASNHSLVWWYYQAMTKRGREQG